MNLDPVAACPNPNSDRPEANNQIDYLQHWLIKQLQTEGTKPSQSLNRVGARLAVEIKRICQKSDRIQKSGEVHSWEMSLARHRVNKYLSYYRLGSSKGRTQLHSNLSVIIYRHIAPSRSHLGFQGRYNLIEDFLQNFYGETLKAFRRENDVLPNYQPRTRIELAEYMAFTEQYAKRNISFRNGHSQQLIILRAQTFARRQPDDAVVDIEQAVEFTDDEQALKQSHTLQQIREKMMMEVDDPTDSIARDRLITALFQYFQDQGHGDCADYLTLKLQDFSASEIDELLGLTPRERDYLQQRFKYHLEKFSRSAHWKLVHQWLGAELEQKLGLTPGQWVQFCDRLSPVQNQILQGKMNQKSPEAIAQATGLTPKKVQKQWTKILDQAWQLRNQ